MFRVLRSFKILPVAAFVAAAPAQALVIDDFNDGTLILSTPAFDTVDGSGIVGGERDMVGSFWLGSFSSNAAGNGLLQITAAAPEFDTVPGYNVRYDGDDNTTANNFIGLNGVDLTDSGASNAIRIRVVRSTTEIEIQFEVSEQKTPGDNTFAQFQIVLPVVDLPTDFLLPFADFDNPGCGFCDDTSPLSFDNIDWMEVSIYPTTQTPFTLGIDFIDTVAAAVPAPSTLATLGLGLGIVGITDARRRRRLVPSSKRMIV
jgi:hypothetical protein